MTVPARSELMRHSRRNEHENMKGEMNGTVPKGDAMSDLGALPVFVGVEISLHQNVMPSRETRLVFVNLVWMKLLELGILLCQHICVFVSFFVVRKDRRLQSFTCVWVVLLQLRTKEETSDSASARKNLKQVLTVSLSLWSDSNWVC